MKLIALDVGTKRIGVAKADSKVRIAIPYSAVEVDGEEFKKIASLARAWAINNFVLGLPRNSQGEETKQSLYVRKFAKELKAAIPEAKICFQDESLTSVEAEKRLEKRKKGFKKGDVDSEAAAIILQDFLEEKIGKTTTRAAATKRRSSVKGAKPHTLMTAAIAVVLVLIVIGAGGFFYYNQNLKPVAEIDCGGNTEADACDLKAFKVENGASVSEVATSLKEENLIRDAFVFQMYFRLNANGESLKAGEYEFNQTMDVEKIAGLLLHGSDGVYQYTVLPGDDLRQIRKDLADLGYKSENVEAALTKDYRGESFGWIFEGMPEGMKNLEGYLQPETYEFYRDDNVETVVKRLLQETAEVIEENGLKEKFTAQGLNVYQAITLASIVQKEAQGEDMAKVAQVFLNRLRNPEAETRGMLGSDVTAQYAVNLVDPERKTYTDNAMIVEIDSPYNTRKYPGLPYGPISNPSFAALKAVAEPNAEVAGMLYFLAGDDGQTYFAADDAGHQYNIQNFCKILCQVSL